MTPEQWQQLESIFHAALELEPEQRAAFLDQACCGDEGLSHEVQSLLASQAMPVNIIDIPPVDEVVKLLAADDKRIIAGQRIDHYEILSRIGAGGMGEVYAAEDKRLGRKVALKLLPAVFTKDEKQVSRLQQEARAASALNHPNIITIYELGQLDSLHFIAMELIEGDTLRQNMQGSGIRVREALDVAIQVASGLSAAHQAGIIHRDIKPENIMLGNDGYVKVLDFGIAKFKQQQAFLSNPRSEMVSIANTQSSALAGTLSYMSPEQARGEPLDARTDIFSMGVLLYEMVTGRRPFAGETQAETLQAILNCEPQPLSAFRRDISPDLQRIVNKALKNNRDERYQSAREMLTDLRECNEETDKAMDAKERANRMLRQYLSIYAVDKRALIPITKQWFIRHHSDLESGERGRELLKKSLRQGLLKAGALTLLLVVITTSAAAWFSRNEEWKGVKLSDGHTRAVRQAVFSPDGRLLVSVGEDAKVIVWDFARRERLATLSDHTGWVVSVAFSPDGKWFATAGYDKTTIVWNATTLEKAAVLREHQSKVSAVAFSPDGRLLASISDKPDTRIIVWDVGRWEKRREFTAGAGDPFTLIFSPNSRWIFGSHYEQNDQTSYYYVWDVVTGQPIVNQELATQETNSWYGPVRALSPDAAMLVVVEYGKVDFWDASQYWTRKKRNLLSTRPGHQDWARAVAFSPDSRLVATGSEDIILWDAKTQKKITHLEHTAIVWGLAFSPDGRWLVSTHGDGAILVWDVAERKRAASFNEHSEAVRAVAFSPDGKQIASASDDSSVILWDAEHGEKQKVLMGHTTRVTGIAFSPDGSLLASGAQNGEIILWDMARRQPRWMSKGSTNECATFSPDNRWLATTNGVLDCNDGHWVVQGDDDKDWQLAGGEIYGVAFSTDGHRLACVSPKTNGILSLWGTTNWQLFNKVEMEGVQLICVSFSPDGKQLVTGDDDGAVRLWQIDPLKEIGVIGRHASRLKSIAFSPDGRQVASAGDDKTIALWDVEGRKLVTHIGTHTARVMSIAFSPDGKRIVSGEEDKTVNVYTRHRTLWGHRLD
jgi:WD40 repeat protein/serine/threonine protein kinase